MSSVGKININRRATCIKGLIWPPLEPKNESYFSPISSDWFIRRITQVKKSGITYTVAIIVTKRPPKYA